MKTAIICNSNFGNLLYLIYLSYCHTYKLKSILSPISSDFYHKFGEILKVKKKLESTPKTHSLQYGLHLKSFAWHNATQVHRSVRAHSSRH